MKTLLTIAMIFFISCNDQKDPPDDGLERIVKIERTDSLINKP
jgi:hypothetical protein